MCNFLNPLSHLPDRPVFQVIMTDTPYFIYY